MIINSGNDLSKQMKLILESLQLYIDNIHIFKFSIKLDHYNRIKIYAYVDIYSKNLYND